MAITPMTPEALEYLTVFPDADPNPSITRMELIELEYKDAQRRVLDWITNSNEDGDMFEPLSLPYKSLDRLPFLPPNLIFIYFGFSAPPHFKHIPPYGKRLREYIWEHNKKLRIEKMTKRCSKIVFHVLSRLVEHEVPNDCYMVENLGYEIGKYL